MSTLTKSQIEAQLPKLTSSELVSLNSYSQTKQKDNVWLANYGSGADDSVELIVDSIVALDDTDYFDLQSATTFSLTGKRNSRPC